MKLPPDEARLVIDSGDGARVVWLSSFLDPALVELAETEANRWIKHLRHLKVGGTTLRDRFTHHGDSLWWFIELFLHKERAVVHAFRAIFASERLIELERPARIEIAAAGRAARLVLPQVAARGAVRIIAKTRGADGDPRRRQAAFFILSAWFNALTRRASASIDRAPVVGFVHSAFWRADTNDESYVGDVIRELSDRAASTGSLLLVGVGPQTRLKGRGWRERLMEFSRAVPRVPFRRIEELSARADATSPVKVWRQARRDERALLESPDLPRAARIRGCDAWPLLRREFSGVALLQLPWSRLAMDQAAAALDTLTPKAIFTYAEAGGWGRALILEARRRSIASIGLQHGFIYRHWLNYLHDVDEMQPSRANAADRGFPHPDATLVFDRLAERHLRECGRLPGSSIRVTGSARLDSLAARHRAITASDRERIRRAIGARDDQRLVLVASKFTQIEPVLASLVAAVEQHPDLLLVIKMHPAEGPDSYRGVAGRVPNVAIAPASADLAELVASSSLVVTVNSTVALEALVLGVPSLVLALPNNLSPFVDAGVMSGVDRPNRVAAALEALLYDEEQRSRLAEARAAFLQHNGLVPDGRAAARAADTILHLAFGDWVNS